ncbi:hypothetical protein [Desulfosporosinus meridiei]|uniref:Uncharacterized protein n=1 Tax=Desulfosporosinus meridiei (strain ATCC BAA-275 / DSM 13257 / KCTC 12902 / NCIMB 13706 / S10) TaxID=768704 RepID=J7IQW4_DESMD|nr:hypothetical protein [Desulfosporosinus meridiei]AFQ44242.1 hypothetical protein Desmer_2309 [Desulfosporosinus meridiei DSM 13257]
MAFTITSTNSGSTAGTADVALTLSPATALFSPAALVPGESLGSPQLSVTNSGDVDAFYFIFADWQADGTTSAVQAQILADRLNIGIAQGTTELYNGPVSGLIEQPTGGRILATTDEELLTFVVSLPATSSNIVEGLDLSVDLVFVSQASPVS